MENYVLPAFADKEGLKPFFTLLQKAIMFEERGCVQA